MSTKNPAIDQYLLKSESFAFPILNHLRTLVHFACPDVKESIKWGFPHFEYKNSILCNMAAFKKHASFGIWLGSFLKDPYHLMDVNKNGGMGSFGKLEKVEDLPSDDYLVEYLKEAMQLIEQGVKLTKAKSDAPKDELEIPDDFLSSLAENLAAKDFFSSFSYAKKREYLVWIKDAKTESTRIKRIAQAIEWISEGKSRNWKYEKC